ncbi:hypothetical protein [Desertivirga arenae]|uniref:hypothetical protein n=1 Tax=Desertivirga arenae TaxID=2810309 RepID=UPI001A97BFA0|nr:hypothetical protein [Pedobacter sp. SYSU D00823]
MHFKSFSDDVKISGQAILASLQALSEYSLSINELLAKYGLENIIEGQWYDFQRWLDVLKDVSNKYGPNTIFALGKGVANNVPDLKLDFKSLLASIDGGYKMNHVGGDVGFIELESFDENARSARLKNRTPYPGVYGRGVLVGLIRKFRPVPGAVPKVEIETTEDEEVVYLNVYW